MNDKVTVVISDGSDDEICAVYSVNKEGVIVIDDDSDTTNSTPCPEAPNVKENTRFSCLKDNADLPSTSRNENKSTSQPSSPDRLVKSTTQVTQQDPNIKKSQSPGKTKLKSSNPNNKSDPSGSNDQNKLPSTSNVIKHPRTSTDNKSIVPPSSKDREVFFEPAPKRHVTGDLNFVVTIGNNLSDSKKANFQDKCNVPPATDKHGPTSHKRRRTESPPCSTVRKTSNESSMLEFKSKQCSKNTNSHSAINENINPQCSSHSTYERNRTKSAPNSVPSSNKHGHTSHEQSRTKSAPSSVPSSNKHGHASREWSQTQSAPSSVPSSNKHGHASREWSRTQSAPCNVPSSNKHGHASHERSRTQSAPCSTVGKTSNENILLEQKSKQCSKNMNFHSANNNKFSPHCSSHSTYERNRTKSAPCGTSSKAAGNSSHIPSRSCSTDTYRRNNSRKRKRKNSQARENITSGSNISCASSSTLPQTSAASSSRQVLSNLQNSNLPTDSLENLSTFSHIIFIDLDNWGKFFHLPYALPPKVFVWGFCGGNYAQKPKYSVHFCALVQEKRFFQHPKCGKSKNAADFALCVQAARLDLQLPIHIPFTVLSGDKGFGELKTQLASSARQIHLVDPHVEEPGVLHAMLASIGQT